MGVASVQERPSKKSPRGGSSKTCIIVAGMHRSGTSATTRVINLLGADITKELMPALANVNGRGYWESVTVYNIHDELLRELGSSWDDPLPLAHGWLNSAAARHAKRLIVDHINDEFSDSHIFVVKDPRIARLLPLWLEVLDEMGTRSIIVIPFRNPLEVAASLEKRDQLSSAKSMLSYARSNLEVELASRGRTRIFHLYDELVSDWRTFAEKITHVGGLNGRSSSAETAAEIDNFLTDELHHHKFSHDELANSPDLAMTIVEIYDRMLEAATPGNNAPLTAEFDRLRATVEEATKLYGALLTPEVKNYQIEIARLHEKLHDVQRRRDVRFEELNAQVRQGNARLDEMNIQIQQRVTEIEGLRTQVVELKHRQVEDRHAYSMILNSTSWRVTAPFRSIRRMLSSKFTA